MSTLHSRDDDIDLIGDFARETGVDPDSMARFCADIAGIRADRASLSADSAHESAMAALNAASAASSTLNTVIWFVVGIVMGLVMALVTIVLVDTIVTFDHSVAESPLAGVGLAATLRG
ncbi:hypothetical protein A5761_26130 [Mycolicibacterium setense]|uniref:hypothetical protein n=1 Tax=Mycolicibacterium setense TaxID=431269 RepID=UPI0007EA076C|nr:hypothetical protein [Mycolicibacterium setense]OBB10981.1 hypothetical protein A5761_26130 [Mycolicibacterium setense]